MGLLTELRARARHVIGPVIGLCVAGYFAYHAVHGERGVIAWFNMEQRLANAQAKLDAIRAERRGWEHKVALLHPESIDRDMLDERARRMLGLGAKDEIIIFEKPDLR